MPRQRLYNPKENLGKNRQGSTDTTKMLYINWTERSVLSSIVWGQVTVGCAATYTESGLPAHPHAPVARMIRLLTMSSRTALQTGKRGTNCGQMEWTTKRNCGEQKQK
jgi:hypothetical protein